MAKSLIINDGTQRTPEVYVRDMVLSLRQLFNEISTIGENSDDKLDVLSIVLTAIYEAVYGAYNTTSYSFDIRDYMDKVGYTLTYSYYTAGVSIPANPSGNKNVETLIISSGATTILTKTYTYDSDDDVLTITNS